MKLKTILLTVYFIVTHICISFSQEIQKNPTVLKPRKNVINLNLTSLFIGHYGLSYERVVGKRTSLRLYGDIANLKYTGQNNQNLKFQGFGIVPEFRYYVSKKGAPYGYFIGLYSTLRSYTINGSFYDQATSKNFYGNDVKLTYWGIGFVTGPQWIFARKLSLAIPFGISIGKSFVTGEFSGSDNNGNVETETLNAPFVNNAFMLRFAIELGVAF